MSADVDRRACAWATCDDAYAIPGSLFCAPHGRQARAENTPWRHPESAPPREPLREVPTFSAPPPASPPARPLQPALPLCRREGCEKPPLAKTIASRSNRWRNLCADHYAEARRNALGTRRRVQLEDVAPPAPIGGDVPIDPNTADWRRPDNVGGLGPDHGEDCQPWCRIVDHAEGACRDEDGRDWAERTEHAIATRDPAPAIVPAMLQPLPIFDPPTLPGSYTERAAELIDLAARVDDARAELEHAIDAWRVALATLAG